MPVFGLRRSAATGALRSWRLRILLSRATREAPQLPPALVRAMKAAGIPANHISIHVRDAGTDEAVVELNADQPRSPASTIKVLTTFAALDTLGPSYTWKTHAYRTGRLANGVLTGDLILVGGGDPVHDQRTLVELRAEPARDSGWRRSPATSSSTTRTSRPSPQTAAISMTQPYRSYNVLPDALMVNFQTSRFTFTVNPQRARPQISVNPLPANLTDRRIRQQVGAGRCQRLQPRRQLRHTATRSATPSS